MSDAATIINAARAKQAAAAQPKPALTLDPAWPYRVEAFDHSLITPAQPVQTAL
jgi:hypothetical protein